MLETCPKAEGLGSQALTGGKQKAISVGTVCLLSGFPAFAGAALLGSSAVHKALVAFGTAQGLCSSLQPVRDVHVGQNALAPKTHPLRCRGYVFTF